MARRDGEEIRILRDLRLPEENGLGVDAKQWNTKLREFSLDWLASGGKLGDTRSAHGLRGQMCGVKSLIDGCQLPASHGKSLETGIYLQMMGKLHCHRSESKAEHEKFH